MTNGKNQITKLKKITTETTIPHETALTVYSQSEKAKNFSRLAEKRLENIKESFRVFQQLGRPHAKYQYETTQRELETYFDEFEKIIQETRKLFQKSGIIKG